MVLLGLLMIGAGALVIVAAVFTVDQVGGTIEVVGLEVSALGLFLLGVAAAAAILLGLSATKFGTRRTLAHRREQKRLTELSEKLDAVESDRRRDDGESPRPGI